jgi:hypothetical protein
MIDRHGSESKLVSGANHADQIIRDWDMRRAWLLARQDVTATAESLDEAFGKDARSQKATYPLALQHPRNENESATC